MIDVYYVPIEQIKEVDWKGNSRVFDSELYNLGQSHDDFIIINPAYANFKFYENIKSIPYNKDHCVVWKWNNQWIAKYFNSQWNNVQRFVEVELEISPDIIWERNPEIDDNIVFNQPIIEDCYDLNYQMIWYLNEQFNPTQDKVWVLKCSLKGYTPEGTKDMGYVSPTITYNPDLPNLEYDINDKIPYYDLIYEHIWLADDSITDEIQNVWIAKITPNNSKGVKIVGAIKINLPKQLDVVFISYNESNAEENWQRVLEKSPKAFRVNGVNGIVNAHKCAAELVTTDMFYVVDGDAWLVDEWDFTFQPNLFDRDCVHVWRSINPVNNLEYGYGGVKLIPKELMLLADPANTDMTTSISKKFKIMDRISNVTAFNTSEFNTWRSAFSECAKLSGGIMKRQLSRESQKRLKVWCSEGKYKPYGEWAIKGAIAGYNYGKTNSGDLEALGLINDFNWLESEFAKVLSLNNILLGDI